MKTLTKKHAGLLNMTGSMASVLAALFSFAISPLLQQQIRIRAEQVQGSRKKRNGGLRWVKRSAPSGRGGKGKKRSEDMNPVAGERVVEPGTTSKASDWKDNAQVQGENALRLSSASPSLPHTDEQHQRRSSRDSVDLSLDLVEHQEIPCAALQQHREFLNHVIHSAQPAEECARSAGHLDCTMTGHLDCTMTGHLDCTMTGHLDAAWAQHSQAVKTPYLGSSQNLRESPPFPPSLRVPSLSQPPSTSLSQPLWHGEGSLPLSPPPAPPQGPAFTTVPRSGGEHESLVATSRLQNGSQQAVNSGVTRCDLDSASSLDVTLPFNGEQVHFGRRELQGMMTTNLLVLIQSNSFCQKANAELKGKPGKSQLGRNALDLAGKGPLAAVLKHALSGSAADVLVDSAQAGGLFGRSDGFIRSQREFMEVKGAQAKLRLPHPARQHAAMSNQYEINDIRLEGTEWRHLFLVCRPRQPPRDWFNVEDLSDFWLGHVTRERVEEALVKAGKSAQGDLRVTVTPGGENNRNWLGSAVSWVRFPDVTKAWWDRVVLQADS